MELLRQAKRQAVAERDYMILWKLLHDLVLVVLLDFEIDVEAMERENDPTRLEAALADADAHVVRVELVRYYFYDWGFTPRSFFEDSPRPSSAVLLVGLAWLLAFSRFFERQHQAILQLYLNGTSVLLPPYPDDVLVASSTAQQLAARALDDAKTSNAMRLDCAATPPSEASVVHQLQALFGRLESVLRALESYHRYHARLLARVKAAAQPPGDDPEDALPVYAVRLLSCGGQEEIELHVRALAERVQMVADEKSFYKWINGIVPHLQSPVEVTEDSLSAVMARLSVLDDALGNAVESANTSCQAMETLRKQVAQRFAVEWKKWKQSTTSRAKIQAMETKMQQLEHDIITRELIDPSTLFLADKRTAVAATAATNPQAQASSVDAADDARLAIRRSELETVMNEIVTTYCHAQWI
ncbi:hypothetical protein PINS_up012844 [Pythium insidiosum]|nr:hypothetical protein PINS_up012844 [Pythium insidiosum]